MNLNSTLKSLEVKLASAVATTELPFTTGYSDANQVTMALAAVSSQDGTTNGTTAVTIMNAPGASTTRKLTDLSIVNVDTAAVTVTIQLNNNGTTRIVKKFTLNIGDCLGFDDGDWSIYSITGEKKTVSITTQFNPGYDGEDGIDGFPGLIGLTGATGPAGAGGSGGGFPPGIDPEESDLVITPVHPDNYYRSFINFNPTDFNTFIGYQAGLNIVAGANKNVFIGYQAGLSSVGSSTNAATFNVGIGHQTMYSNTIGYQNMAFGAAAMYTNTGGYQNVAIGFASMYFNTTGQLNVGLGSNSLYHNTTGYGNMAIGYRALELSTTGVYNVAVGVAALASVTTGYDNVGIGNAACGLITYANRNVGIGSQALYNNVGGYYQVGMGYNTGIYIADGVTPNQLSNTSIYIGANVRAFADGDANEIIIGDSAIGAGSNTVTLGNTSITTTILRGNVGAGTTSPSCKIDILGNGTGVVFRTQEENGYGCYVSVRNTFNFNYGDNANDTTFFNYHGYNDSTTRFRSIEIDDGKTNLIAFFDGPTRNVGIGTSTVPSLLTVAGLINMKNYTVATLPAGTRGDIAYCTDLLAPGFLVAAVGGGAVVGPVFYNGANWVAF